MITRQIASECERRDQTVFRMNPHLLQSPFSHISFMVRAW